MLRRYALSYGHSIFLFTHRGDDGLAVGQLHPCLALERLLRRWGLLAQRGGQRGLLLFLCRLLQHGVPHFNQLPHGSTGGRHVMCRHEGLHHTLDIVSGLEHEVVEAVVGEPHLHLYRHPFGWHIVAVGEGVLQRGRQRQAHDAKQMSHLLGIRLCQRSVQRSSRQGAVASGVRWRGRLPDTVAELINECRYLGPHLPQVILLRLEALPLLY
mmetsp:Transcript_2615/g.4759  ORF Transcript_2615/g.4759 Transcript_2615/m.4759 type:complete len:212 (+) Transcript_2615:283-918(+)